MKKYLFLWLVIILLIITANQTPKPIDRTAFSVLATFYEYDHEISFEVKTVRHGETPLYTREKLSFA